MVLSGSIALASASDASWRRRRVAGGASRADGGHLTLQLVHLSVPLHSRVGGDRRRYAWRGSTRLARATKQRSCILITPFCSRPTAFCSHPLLFRSHLVLQLGELRVHLADALADLLELLVRGSKEHLPVTATTPSAVLCMLSGRAKGGRRCRATRPPRLDAVGHLLELELPLRLQPAAVTSTSHVQHDAAMRHRE